MGLGDRLKKVMKELDVSQAQVAEKTNVTRQNISNIINDKGNPSVEWVRKLVIAFPEINCRWFVAGEGDMLVNIAQLNESKINYDCENCKRLNSYIEKQERLIERLERQLGQNTENKKVV